LRRSTDAAKLVNGSNLDSIVQDFGSTASGLASAVRTSIRLCEPSEEAVTQVALHKQQWHWEPYAAEREEA
jgi:hypothetical protein